MQMVAGSLEVVDPIELLGRSSQCLADVLGGGQQYIMALWEPCLESAAGLKVDVLGLAEDEIPESQVLSMEMESLLRGFLTDSQMKTQFTVREGERSEWDAWEAGAVDGYRVVYGLYEPGRVYKRA